MVTLLPTIDEAGALILENLEFLHEMKLNNLNVDLSHQPIAS
jgi:hypothetical protein